MSTSTGTAKNKGTTRSTGKGTDMMMSMGTGMMKNRDIEMNRSTMMMSMGTRLKSTGTMMNRCMGTGMIDSKGRNRASSMGRESRNNLAIASKDDCMSVSGSRAKHLVKPFCYDGVETMLARLRFQQYVSHVFISSLFIISFTYPHLSISLVSQPGCFCHLLSSFIFPCDPMPISNLDLSSFSLVLLTI